MGKATFIDIQDGHGKIQALLRRDNLPDSYDDLKELDIGDFIGVEGPLFRTRSGEITVEARGWTLLSKALRSLPEKWHGLSDVEVRYRQRYLDLIANDDARRVAVVRSRTVSGLRRLMDARGFMEVETPVLVPVAAGGTARPFLTHHNTLDRDLYLRIATELYLKRLIVGGLEKVYEVGRIFRNEGVDFTHNPEFTMMESYEAYADYNDVMRMVEEMVSTLAQEVLGSTSVELDGVAIELAPPWPRETLRDAVKGRTGIDFLECSDIESLRSEMAGAGLDVGQQMSWGGLLDKLVSTAVEPHIVQPTFLVDYPVEMSPLAKRKRGDPRLVERFEGFVAGMEVCNAFTELNDPIDQRRRLEEQEALHAQFEDEDMDRLDEDFLVALEHGMPPTGGLGLGVDRLVMLFSGERSIREVVLFPQLRSR
jgi:lysyl-tRNA synthetase class 2